MADLWLPSPMPLPNSAAAAAHAAAAGLGFAGIGSEAQIEAVVWFGWAIACVAFALVVTVIGLRIRLSYMSARERRFFRRWRPLLTRAALGDKIALPPIDDADLVLLFGLWNFMHDSVRGSARGHLNEVAKQMGLEVHARAWLSSRNARLRLVALIALGNMRNRATWATWRDLLDDESPVVSLASLRGMLLTDPRLAMQTIIPRIAEREDWSPTRVATFLNEAGTDVVAGPLAQAALQVPPQQAARLVRYLAALDAEPALPAVRSLAHSATDPGLLAACIPMLRGFEDLSRVRDLTRHPAWFVRVQAATALGRMGVPGDEDVLLMMLNDREWWVRYRSAQALYNLNFLSEDEFELIRARQDGFARDMLEQVYAEGPFR